MTTGLPGWYVPVAILALERFAVRTPEATERLGPDAADARVAVLRVDNLVLPLS